MLLDNELETFAENANKELEMIRDIPKDSRASFIKRHRFLFVKLDANNLASWSSVGL